MKYVKISDKRRTWTWKVHTWEEYAIEQLIARMLRALRQGSVGHLSDWIVGNAADKTEGKDFHTKFVVSISE